MCISIQHQSGFPLSLPVGGTMYFVIYLLLPFKKTRFLEPGLPSLALRTQTERKHIFYDKDLP